MRGEGGEIKWRGGYFFLENGSVVKLEKEKQESKLN